MKIYFYKKSDLLNHLINRAVELKNVILNKLIFKYIESRKK